VGCEGEVHRLPPPPHPQGGSHERSPMDVHSLSSALRSLCAIAIKKNEALTWLTTTCNSLSLSLFLSFSLSFLRVAPFTARVHVPRLVCQEISFISPFLPSFGIALMWHEVTRALVHLTRYLPFVKIQPRRRTSIDLMTSILSPQVIPTFVLRLPRERSESRYLIRAAHEVIRRSPQINIAIRVNKPTVDDAKLSSRVDIFYLCAPCFVFPYTFHIPARVKRCNNWRHQRSLLFRD